MTLAAACVLTMLGRLSDSPPLINPDAAGIVEFVRLVNSTFVYARHLDSPRAGSHVLASRDKMTSLCFCVMCVHVCCVCVRVRLWHRQTGNGLHDTSCLLS